MKIKIYFKICLFYVFILNSKICIAQEFKYKEHKELAGYEDFVLDATFSPFRNYFALTTGNNKLYLYNKHWELIFEHQGNPESRAGLIAFSPDEQYLAYAKYKYVNDIVIIRLEDLKIIQTITKPKGNIFDLKFSTNGKYLAACSDDKIIRVWKQEGKNYILHDELSGHERIAHALAFNSDSKTLISGGTDKRINIYKLINQHFELSQSIPTQGYIKGLVFHPEDDVFCAGTYENLRVFEKKGKEYTEIQLMDLRINGSLTFSPNGNFLITGSSKTLRILKVENNKFNEFDILYRHADHVFGGSFSDDGKFMVTQGSDKVCIIWEIEGVKPTNKSLLVEYLGGNLSKAQQKILEENIVDKILEKIDKKLGKPKDEFETTPEYHSRMEKLHGTVLGKLQQHLEKEYQIKEQKANSEVIIPIQHLVSYNADLQVYKIQFMETEAGVEIPIEDAKILKQQIDKAFIKSKKNLNKSGLFFDYTKFELIHPNKKSYTVTPVENPFNKNIIEARRIRTKIATRNDEITPVETNEVEIRNNYSIQALLFASNVYDSYNQLINPVFDARTIYSELRNNYNGYVELVENPKLNEAISKIRDYAKRKYSDNDYLLVFFAGHGTYDEVFGEGYVVFRDSKLGDEAKTSYLSHSNLRTMVSNIPCKHILLVMDVCFGGTFDPLVASRSRSAGMYADISNEEYLKRKSNLKTRLYLTSGGKEYVPDGRPGQHSPFARKIIEALRNYGGEDGILNISEIITYIEKVDPMPCFGEFGENEPGSDFLIIAE